MQRKNYFLKTSRGVRKFRNAMAMIMAIIVLVVIATVMSLSLALTIQTSKRTTDLYLYEQAVLVSQSAAEYAMLRISQTTAGNKCSIPSDNYSYNAIYDVNVTMKYVSNAGTECATKSAGNSLGTVTYVDTNGLRASNGSVMLDITVSTKPEIATEPIRYFRRSIQKM